MAPDEVDQLVSEVQDELDALEEFRSDFEKRIEALGDPGSEYWDEPPVVTQKLDDLETRVDDLQTKLNRPGDFVDDPSEKQRKQEAREAFGEFLRKGADNLEPEHAKLLATDDEQTGGFRVPPPVQADLIEELVEISPIRANANVQQISQGDALEIPVDEGSFTATWAGERESVTETETSTFSEIRIQAHELRAFPKATQKMIQDAEFDLPSYIQRKLAERFGKKENSAFLDGDANGKPEGILHDLTNSDVRKVTSATGGEFDADDVLDLIFEVPTEFTSNAALYCHRKQILRLRKLKDSNGQYLWEPALTQDEPSTFAGVPVVEVPDMDDTETTGDHVFLFGELDTGYTVVDRTDMTMVRDELTDKPNVGWYTTRRTGGGLTRGDALAVLEVS